MKELKRGTLIAALIAAAAAAGCAQDIGDIDRTEPNRIKKSDLTGAWWMHQKVVEVPGSSSLESFEGLMMDTEKVVFVAEEHYLMAYRSYPILPGSDDQNLNMEGENSYEELYGANYKGNVLAMYPITSHFDVQRVYDPATGEQGNVIVENMSDRPWYERDYIRVNWYQNPIVNFEWYLWYDMDYEIAGYQGVEETDPLKAPYFEYTKDGELTYFDVPTVAVVQTTIWDWYYNMAGWEYADGKSAIEIRIATSFGKDLGDADDLNNYESLDYSNQDMNRFGYFRTERDTYDPQLGIMNSGRIQFANRHNIWKKAYEADGTVIPVENREVRTIPYYIHDGVHEELLAKMSEQVIDEWNIAFKRAVYLMQHPDNTFINGVNLVTEANYEKLRSVLGSDWASTQDPNVPRALAAGNPDIFVPCHIPVRSDDDAVCGGLVNGERVHDGYVPREGDFRNNYLWLVNQRQDVGLLGYCPTVVDPLTGRSISAQAHVYTAPMNEIARNLVDQIKYAKGELTIDGVRTNDANVARARLSRDKFVEYAKLSDQVRSAQLNSKKAVADKNKRHMERSLVKKNLRKFDYTSADAKLGKLINSGLLASDVDSAALNGMAHRMGVSASQLPEKAVDAASLFNQLSFASRANRREMEKKMGAKGYCFKNEAANYDIQYSEYLNKYKDRTDYDQIFNELRAEVFRSTALHEMGHGFGLRHNHTGSYDSMNYFDKYWELREGDELFYSDKINTVGDMYALYDYSTEADENAPQAVKDRVAKRKAELEGGLLGNMYSSIMDYSANYAADNKGLGKYDLAAILYGYSAGASNGGDPTGLVKQRKGLVEVFTKPGSIQPAGRDDLGEFAYDVLKHKDTTKITSTFDDQTAVGQPYLELVNYRDFFSSLHAQNYNWMKNRALKRMDDYLQNNTDSHLATKDAWVRVPYLFCTDDNRGSLRSCNVFDHGADYYEQVSDIFRTYDVNYWFSNFARGRAYWDAYSASYRYRRSFMMLSDFLQNDYVSDWSTLRGLTQGHGYTLSDDVNDAASAASFNFIANVIATPEYGLFCKRTDNGALFNLSTDGEASSDINEFSQRSRCGRDADYFYVRQGEGRRRYQKYDVEAGFDYSQYELELEHNYTSLWAILALFDNEANVIVDTGDLGTYTLGMYTRYREEAIKLINGVLGEEYSIHSPILVSDDGKGGVETTTYNNEEVKTGHLQYPALVVGRYYGDDDSRVEYDPLTGKLVNDFNAKTASVPMGGVCTRDADCMMGDADMVFCDVLYNKQRESRCFPAWYDKEDAKCPAGTVADDVGVFACVLDASSGTVDHLFDQVASIACSDSHLSGACEDGKTCVSGKCENVAHRVESTSSLTQKLYMTLYGMLLTGPIEMDPTLYDQFNIYRMGSGQTNDPAPGFQRVTFENPFTGEVYGANDMLCGRDKDGNRTSTCYPISDVDRPGSAILIAKAQDLANKVVSLYDEVLEIDGTMTGDEKEGDEVYEQFIDVYYSWYRAKYDLENTVRDINIIRSVYDIFATMW